MICHDFRVHRTGVFLFLLMLLLDVWAIGVNRPYLCSGAEGYRARD